MAENSLNISLSSSEYPNIVVDKDMNIVSFNEIAFNLISATMGVRPAKGDSVFRFLLPENISRTKTNLNNAFDGKFIKDEFIFSSPGNSAMYFEYIYNPLIDDNGIINSVSISAIDITEFKN